MRCTETFECPNLHFSETLTTKLSFTTQRLLSYERVRTDRTSMHLIFNHVTEFQHISHTNSCRLVELFTGTTITKISLTVTRQTGLVCPLIEIFHGSTIKDRSCKLHTQRFSGTSENSFKYLSDIHT